MNVSYDTEYRLLDAREMEIVKRLNEVIEEHFDDSVTVEYTTYPKGTFPLQCMVKIGDYYLRYNVYRSGEIRNSGYSCSNEMLELSKKYIIIDSELWINTHLLK